jgi:HAD superfamily hydrolase (TIGR01490 family)
MQAYPVVNIFDVDLTIVKKPSALYFAKEAISKKVINFSDISVLAFEWIRYKLGRPNHDFIEDSVKKLKGIKRETIEQICRDCFDKFLKHDIYEEAVQLIIDIQKKEERILFASSSLDVILSPLAKFLGVNEVLASVLEFSNGITTGNIKGISLFGEGKKTVVQEWLEKNKINSKDVSFYSDSYTDIPLFTYVGNPVIVNPDKFLKKEAHKNGWKILNFKKAL